jgi:hypothetical protein
MFVDICQFERNQKCLALPNPQFKHIVIFPTKIQLESWLHKWKTFVMNYTAILITLFVNMQHCSPNLVRLFTKNKKLIITLLVSDEIKRFTLF